MYLCDSDLFCIQYISFQIPRDFNMSASTVSSFSASSASAAVSAVAAPAEVMTEAHKKVCTTVSRFINSNIKAIYNFMGCLADGEGGVEVKTADGCMAFKDYELFIEFYIPFAEEPPAGHVNMRRVTNRINRLLVETHNVCMSGVAAISSHYNADTNMFVIKVVLEEGE